MDSLFALKFLLVGEGLRFTTAAHMVALLYTTPIFVALGLHWQLPAERLVARQWLAVGRSPAASILNFLWHAQPTPDGVAQSRRAASADFLRCDCPVRNVASSPIGDAPLTLLTPVGSTDID